MTIQNGANYKCPAYGGRCEKHRADCPEWVHVQGKNPQTEEHVDMFDCARRWVPVLLLEISQRVNQQGAATESFRNEMVNAQSQFNGILAGATNALLAAKDAPAAMKVISEKPDSA